MIYKFRMLSSEDKAFLRDYEVDADSSFNNFHDLIQHNLGFDTGQLASFFLADEEWNKGIEFTLLDMRNDDGPVAVPMDTVKIGDVLRNRKDRLLYVYDIFTDQHLFLEIIDMYEPVKGKTYPTCCASVGEAPIQFASDVAYGFDDGFASTHSLDDFYDEFDDDDDPNGLDDDMLVADDDSF